MAIKAVNNYVFIIRDKTESEKGGIIIPTSGREKPHTGKVYSIGNLVRDKDIKAAKGKTALFHRGVGFDLEFEEAIYLVLQEHEIIGLA